MTKVQALAMNSRFKSMSRDIDSLKRLHLSTINFVLTQDSINNEQLINEKMKCAKEKIELKAQNTEIIASSAAFITWVTFIYLTILN
jgi:5,10-methylenetetrahydrofolate reductase